MIKIWTIFSQGLQILDNFAYDSNRSKYDNSNFLLSYLSYDSSSILMRLYLKFFIQNSLYNLQLSTKMLKIEIIRKVAYVITTKLRFLIFREKFKTNSSTKLN